MKAVLARGPGDFAVVDRPPPQPPPGGRVLAVEATGVCAADRMLWRGDGPWRVSWPFVPGHELLGRDVATGERLTCEVMLSCGECAACSAGRTNLCPQGTHLGSGIDGAFAERVVLPPGAPVHAVPDDLPLAAAVLAEPMACALHAVRRAGVVPGDRVAVIGVGSVGALALHAARAEEAATVWAVTRSAAKARRARDLGADPPPPDGAAPPDVVVECSGDAAAVGAALDLVRPGGRVCLYGVYRGPSTVDANVVAEHKELDVRGGHLAPGCFPDAIALLRSVDHERIVTAVRPLDDVRAALEPSDALRLKEVLVP